MHYLCFKISKLDHGWMYLISMNSTSWVIPLFSSSNGTPLCLVPRRDSIPSPEG